MTRQFIRGTVVVDVGQYADTIEVRGGNAECVGAVTVAVAFPGTGVPA